MKYRLSVGCVSMVLWGLWGTVNAFAGAVAIDVWTPPFNSEHKHAPQTYELMDKAAKKWRICAVIPHLKDAYWMAANFGLIEEARKLGVALTIQEAGGYDRADVQRQQMESCMATGADALIIGAVKQDGVNDLIKRYVGEGRPVIDLLNSVNSPDISARVAADGYDMTRKVAEYMLANYPGGRVLCMPGPKGMGWVETGYAGIQSAFKSTPFTLVATLWGDTGLAVQAKLFNDFLDQKPDFNYLLGTAVSAEAAIPELRRRGMGDKVKLFATYFSSPVLRGVERGTIEAAPTDSTALQARLAVNVTVRILEKLPYPKHMAAQIQIVDRKNSKTFNVRDSLAPEGFRPLFNVN